MTKTPKEVCEKGKDQAWENYLNIRNPAWKNYLKIEAQALKVYNETIIKLKKNLEEAKA